jgi:hypothetical protein
MFLMFDFKASNAALPFPGMQSSRKKQWLFLSLCPSVVENFVDSRYRYHNQYNELMLTLASSTQ